MCLLVQYKSIFVPKKNVSLATNLYQCSEQIMQLSRDGGSWGKAKGCIAYKASVPAIFNNIIIQRYTHKNRKKTSHHDRVGPAG
jgi:hypothetical protein